MDDTNHPYWLDPPPGMPELRVACGALCRRTAPLGEAAVTAAQRAARGSPEAAFGLGASLLHGGVDQDLGRCWLWVAASFGHGRAAAELARELAAAARDGFVDGTMAVAMASDWLSQADISSPGFGVVPSEPPPPVGDGRVVLPRVGDVESREGREISRRYADVVGATLPYRGWLPAPGVVARDFLKKFPWAPALARYLEGQFALLRSAGLQHPRLPPLLLVGPSGCGKTTMLEWLCAHCGFPSMTVPVGGTNDGAGLGAVARGWVTAQVAAPVQLMADHRCCNPALILDEIDKGVAIDGRNGSVMGVLLSMLQPPAEGYRDACLMAEVDLSAITFLASANTIDQLGVPFLRRFLVMPVPAPGPEHFEAILPGVIAGEAERLGIDPRLLPWLGRDETAWLRGVFARRCNIGDLNTAYRVLMGEMAAQESLAMGRPH